MKNVVVIYNGDDWYKDIPFKSESLETRLSFEDWYERAEEFNFKFYRASLKWFDEEKGVFKKAWAFENKKWIKVSNEIIPSAIFDKTAGKYDYSTLELKMSIFKKVPILNNPLFRIMTNNKLSQYMLFGEYMPVTLLASNKIELLEKLKNTNGEQVVIKPLYGSGGKGIFIGFKEDVEKEDFDFPVIIQEFIKSTKGIPGFSKKNEVSDLRLIFTDNKLVYALSRIAKEGSLFTNFHQGATAILVPVDKIPKSVEEIYKKIVKKISVFSNNNYSLDFIFDDEEKPILVEMNTTPGFDLLRIVGTEETKKLNLSLFLNSINEIIK